MAALKATNKGYTFLWFEGNPYIEVFRKGDPIYAPFEAIDATGINYNDSALKSFANNDYQE